MGLLVAFAGPTSRRPFRYPLAAVRVLLLLIFPGRLFLTFPFAAFVPDDKDSLLLLHVKSFAYFL